MLHLHRLLNATGFTAIIGDVTLVYSRGSEACVVYIPDRPRDPDWLFYQSDKVTEGRGAASLAPLLAREGREAA